LEHPDQSLVAAVGSTLTINSMLGISTKSPEEPVVGVFGGGDVFLSWGKRSYHHLAVLYKAALARDLDYYRLNTIMSDCESILRLVLNGNVAVVEDIIGVWNVHGNNTSCSESIGDAIEDYSYIEGSYKYALERGLDKQKLHEWHRAMVRFHTKSVLRSGISISQKVCVFMPYVLRTYPFAVAQFFSPKSLAVSIARTHPTSYRSAKRFYSKLKGEPTKYEF
jgi:hypothetical protein